MLQSFKKTIKNLSITVLLLYMGILGLYAQSLIAGIPNADVAEKGDIEITHETQAYKTNWHSFNFICYGFRHNMELTSVLTGWDNQGSKNITLALGTKKIIDIKLLSAYQSKIIAGANLIHSFYSQSFGVWVYTLSSIRLPQTKTRFTAGINYGDENIFGYQEKIINNEIHLSKRRLITFMGGIEQPIYHNISVIADWFQGTHNLGALITAIQIDWKYATLITGYKISNNIESGHNALTIELMIKIPTQSSQHNTSIIKSSLR